MKKRGSTVLIGDLLVGAEAVSIRQLEHAVPLAKKTGLPVGRILVESKLVSNYTIRAAVLAQSLIRDNLLHLGLAIKALKLVHNNSITLEDALDSLGWRSDYYERTNKLGDLLVQAGCLNEDQLAAAFEVCFASGLPLGRVLVLRHVLSELVAYTALNAQVLMREKTISREQAIELVRSATHSQQTKSVLQLESGYNQKIRLGELLVMAGFVSEIDLVSAVERALVEESPIGQVLIKAGVINQDLLKSALTVQARINTRVLSVGEGIRALREAGLRLSADLPEEPNETSLQQPLDDMDLKQLLKTAGLPHVTELATAVRELIIQREHLAFAVVSQQEEIKNRVARELHDTIIADLMMLKRYLSGDRALSTGETIEIVDHVVGQLRDICSDFAPRQLQDWGLTRTLQDLLERVQIRTAMRCNFVCDAEIDGFPEPVKLHIFRIVQECLNNVQKYARASELTLTITATSENITFVIEDNGQGFHINRQREPREPGGMGMGGMKERADLIRCYYPTRLTIESEPGHGSRVSLELSCDATPTTELSD